MNPLKLIMICLTILVTVSCTDDRLLDNEFIYKFDGKVYRYFVAPSGDNYNFEFDTSPGDNNAQLKAGIHIIDSIYHDSSVDLSNRQNYIRERARCTLFSGDFHDYTFCVFPNDFSPQKKDRFRGYVTQMPNWKWLVIWNLFPVLLVFGLIFFFTRNKKN